MKTLFQKKAIAIAVTAVLMLSGMGAIVSVITNKKPPEQVKDKKEVNELSKFMDQNEEYQNRVTTFNPDNYSIIQANPSVSVENTNCKNGFGGTLPKINKGMFNQPLFNLNAEKLPTETESEFAYAPYVEGYTLVGDILFKKPYDFFDRKMLTMDQMTRNFSDSRILVGTKEYKNSYKTMESKFGFPMYYIVQQAGTMISTSAFNNECQKQVGITNIQFQKIDLTGLPISSIVSANYQTTLHHGFNGLYNHTSKSPNFVNVNFVEWAQSNNRIYQQILHDPNAVFPKDSYIYIPIDYETLDEIVNIDFQQPPIDLTLEQIRKNLASSLNRPPESIFFVEENVQGYKVYKAVDKTTYDPLNGFAVAEKDKKFYMAYWQLPYKHKLTGNEQDRSSLVLMNQTAMGAVVSLFKSFYQGEALDIGTANEKLDEKTIKSESPHEKKELERKTKELISATQATADDLYKSNTIPTK